MYLGLVSLNSLEMSLHVVGSLSSGLGDENKNEYSGEGANGGVEEVGPRRINTVVDVRGEL